MERARDWIGLGLGLDWDGLDNDDDDDEEYLVAIVCLIGSSSVRARVGLGARKPPVTDHRYQVGSRGRVVPSSSSLPYIFYIQCMCSPPSTAPFSLFPTGWLVFRQSRYQKQGSTDRNRCGLGHFKKQTNKQNHRLDD